MDTFRCGCSGGLGGVEFSDDALPDEGKVVEVVVYHEARVSGVQLAYEGPDGSRHDLELHGSKRGEASRVLLDADEYISSISGRYGERVNLLAIGTSKQESASFGKVNEGPSFSYQAPAGMEIAGFFGRCGTEIDAIGVILRSRATPRISVRTHIRPLTSEGKLRRSY